MKYLNKFFNFFLDLGIDHTPDFTRRAYIHYFNFDLLGYMAFAVVSIFIVDFLPAPIRPFLHEMSIVYILMIAGCFYLNTRGHHLLSSVIINIGLYIAVVITDMRIGSESHIHFFLITVCITPLFFIKDSKWLAYSTMITGFVLFIALSEGYLSMTDAPYATPEIQAFFRRAINILILPLTTIRVFYIFSVNDKYLTEINGQKSYLRMIIDLNPNFIFAKNRKGEFTLVNEALAKTYGTSANELLGKTDADFNRDPSEVEHFRKDDLDVINKGQVKTIPVEEVTDATGHKKYLQTVKTPIIDSTGETHQLLGVSTDITERINIQNEMKGIQEMLRLKNKEMEKYIESNLQLENFAYIASHDLREPLRSIIGYSQLLELRYAKHLDNDGREYIKYLISATKSMNMLISDLLLFSRVNTDKVNFQTILMSEVVGQVMDNLSRTIDETQAEIRWHQRPAMINADRSRLIQLFQNLIGNAIKFHTPGEIPEVDIYYRVAGGMHEFEIKDNGIGIDPKFHEKIFQIFHRLHNRSEFEGSGIGLATCHKIVEQHKGEIHVQSAPGLGSSFIFTLGMI